MIIWYWWVTEAISGESRRDEDLLARPVDIRPPGMAVGEQAEVGGKAIPAKPKQAPRAVVHEGETGVAESTGEGEEGTRPIPGRRRNVRGGGVPTDRKPTEKATPGRIPTEGERLAVEPADVAPADRNNRIGALDWEEAMVTWLDFSLFRSIKEIGLVVPPL